MRDSVWTIAVIALAALAGCATDSAVQGAASPYLVVLGTAQDGGLPHLGCQRACCEAARTDPRRRRLVASLLIVDPIAKTRWLIDATPDIREQESLIRVHPAARSTAGGRDPLVDGIFLTHAHMGHVAGLLQFGREAMASRDVPVFAGPRMGMFLRDQEPWKLLIEARHIDVRPLNPGSDVRLSESVSVTPITVPHRDEFSETFGFVVALGKHRALYIPDIDKWERWDRNLRDEVAKVDIALLDGTFFADGEIPGRAMRDIPHPFVDETLTLMATWPEAERKKVVFTHLNHTNPLAQGSTAALASVQSRGGRIAAEGEIIRP